MRITVIVTEEEHAKIKRAAGLIPLSAFLKSATMKEVALQEYVTAAFKKGKHERNKS
jgi:hypothetical protein